MRVCLLLLFKSIFLNYALIIHLTLTCVGRTLESNKKLT